MNIETREIKDLNDLTPTERASGKWIPVAKKYVQKQPITDADFARILKANERRERRAAKRLGYAEEVEKVSALIARLESRAPTVPETSNG